MAIVTLTNSTSPSTVERPTDDSDPYERETQLNALAHNFDDHDHTAGKNLGVGRVQTSSAPAASGQVRVNGDSYQWWGASAAAVRTAADLESAQTVSGVKTFSAAPVLSAGASTGAAKSYVNDTANAGMTVGLTINQGAADDEALALKSSDVAHGITDLGETDTYGSFFKSNATNGGLSIRGLAASTSIGVDVGGFQGTANTTKSTAGTGAIRLTGGLKSGTGFAALGANANILAVTDAGTTRFLLDADGDSHQDVGTAWTNFDEYDDIGLLTTLAHNISREGNRIRGEFQRWITYHRGALEAAGLVTFNANGRHFVNMSRLTMLLVGAVRQQAARTVALEERFAALERRTLALEAG